PWPRRCGSWVEPVADSPDVDEVAGLVGVGFELVSQPPDVDRDRGGVLIVGGRVPYLFQQLGSAEHLARCGGQEREQVELTGGERDELPVNGDLARRSVDDERAVHEASSARRGAG